MGSSPTPPTQKAREVLLNNLTNQSFHQISPENREYIESVGANLNQFTSQPLDLQANHTIVRDQYRSEGYLYAHSHALGSPPSCPFLRNDLEEKWHRFYCENVGIQVAHVPLAIQEAVYSYIENEGLYHPFSEEERLLIAKLLARATLLERFLHTKYVGKKRFSLEGEESALPMLFFLCYRSNLKKIIMGMAHRGRINILANLLGTPLHQILTDFDEESMPHPDEKMGDVRYHRGLEVIKDHVQLVLLSNASHLESVDPLVEGYARACQDKEGKGGILPVLIHGDAALSGQGIVYETLQLASLHGYETGGTIHLVLNNEIGFTAIHEEVRSTPYCTDIAKAFGIPVFHVNAEDPEKGIRVMQLALSLRNQFGCDIFISLNGYRLHGHNEGDEPNYTNPLLYQEIAQKQPILDRYQQIINPLAWKNLIHEVETELRVAYEAAGHYSKTVPKQQTEVTIEQPAVSLDTLRFLGEKIFTHPSFLTLHPKLIRLLENRRSAVLKEGWVDWGVGEMLAYASLLIENVSVRLSGQDSKRGTFSHRHASWYDQNTGEEYISLAHLQKEQGTITLLNSPLSEEGVLGFEYGYSMASPEELTIWEAQFGDFVNGAQVIIDQYLASGEQKWGSESSLVLFLPHGWEGQGSEHSSARIERFLSLAGHNNIRIIYPTQPAQLFHLLRKQVYTGKKRPLIVFTPKSLLRHHLCRSSLQSLAEGSFQPFLVDYPEGQIEEIILCSGRVAYDLLVKEKWKKGNKGLIRIEQLYPWDQEEWENLVENFREIQKWTWLQEEPENMGPWPFLGLMLPGYLPAKSTLRVVAREKSAAPATGFHARHWYEQEELIRRALGDERS